MTIAYNAKLSLTNTQYLSNQDAGLTDLTFKNKKISLFLFVIQHQSSVEVGINAFDSDGYVDFGKDSKSQSQFCVGMKGLQRYHRLNLIMR